MLLRAGITRLLSDAGFDVVAAVGDAASLVEVVGRLHPDLAVVDVRMPPTLTDDGLRAAIAIRERQPTVAILVLSQYVEERYASDLLAGDTAGIGYLLKDRVADVDALSDGIRRVAAGGTVLDPEVVSRLLSRRRQHDAVDELTAREREVLALMAEGHSNGAIGQRLHIGAKTVETHIGTIFSKLGLLPSSELDRRVHAVLAYLRRY